jgi:hypothetical protein
MAMGSNIILEVLQQKQPIILVVVMIGLEIR